MARWESKVLKYAWLRENFKYLTQKVRKFCKIRDFNEYNAWGYSFILEIFVPFLFFFFFLSRSISSLTIYLTIVPSMHYKIHKYFGFIDE